MLTSSARFSLRPEQPEDEEFRFELYASTRAEELDALGWPQEARARFLELQFKAAQGYYQEFPKADFQIVLVDGQRVGRIVLDRAAEAWELVDIALLAEYRNRGLGTALIQRLQTEAAAAGKPLRLTVLKGHRAARLYKRLGFVKNRETEVHDEMEWCFPHASGPLPMQHASKP